MAEQHLAVHTTTWIETESGHGYLPCLQYNANVKEDEEIAKKLQDIDLRKKGGIV